jgi:hypothetical protein
MDKYLTLLKDLDKLSTLYQTAYYLINLLNSYFFYFKGYFNQSQNKHGFNVIPRSGIIPIFILIPYLDHLNNDQNKENNSLERIDGDVSQDKDNKKESEIE